MISFFKNFSLVTITIFLYGTSHSKDYLVGVEKLSYLPYYSVDQEGDYIGFAREVFDEFAQKHNFSMRFLPYPVIRLTSALITNEIDFKFPDNPAWSADIKGDSNNVKYSQKVVEYIDGIILNKHNYGKKINKITMVRGFTAPNEILNDNRFQLKTVNSMESAIKYVLAGRGEGVFGNTSVIKYNYEYLGNKAFGEEFKFADYLPYTKDNYYISTVKHVDIIEKFNSFLNSSDMEKILKKYDLL